MIQLATDPNASRSQWRPAAAGAQDGNLARRPKPSHAWPFISRHAERIPTQQESKPTRSSDSGS